MFKPVEIDWKALEAEMFRLAKSDIAEFAKRYPDETYYGFWLDCNATYGQVLLCLNSIEALEHSAHNLSAAELQYRKAFREMDIRMYERMCEKLGEEYRSKTPNPADTEPVYDDDPDMRRERLRWSPGDWKYQGFNSAAWGKGEWDQLSTLVIDAVMDDEPPDDDESDDWKSSIAERFMVTACRALVALEEADVFAGLNRTADFTTHCADHDESLEDADERLSRVRAEMRSEE